MDRLLLIFVMLSFLSSVPAAAVRPDREEPDGPVEGGTGVNRSPAAGLRAVLLSCCALAPLEATGSTAFDAGSLIVPMDTTYQDMGMLEAFGLVYGLLTAGVDMDWCIGCGVCAVTCPADVISIRRRRADAAPESFRDLYRRIGLKKKERRAME